MPIILNNNTDNQGAFPYVFGMFATLLLAAGFTLAYIQPGMVLTDGGIFTAVALKDLQNGTLYLDAWENKPPGIFYLSELFLLVSPDRVTGIFAMVFLVFSGSAACVFHLVFNYLKSLSATLLLMGISLFWMIHKDTIGDGLYTEIPGILCVLISLVFAEKYRAGGHIKHAYAACVAMGFSFWFKEPFILMCIPLAGLLLTVEKRMKTGHLLVAFLGILIPSVLFITILYTQGALKGFIDMVLYNVSYISAENSQTGTTKFRDLYAHLIEPNAGLVILFVVLLYKILQSPGKTTTVASYLAILLFSGLFIFISPYSFGHYNYPVYALFVPVIAAVYGLFVQTYSYGLKLPLIIVSIYTLYNIDNKQNPQWKLKIEPYIEDHFTTAMKQDSGKTLFVDFADAGSYYLKTGLLYPTHLPVPLLVHVNENESGNNNRERIMQALQTHTPDYLISAEPSSEFSWHYPGFYKDHFNITDSLDFNQDTRIYLWKRKTNP